MPIIAITAAPGTGKSVYLMRLMKQYLKESIYRESRDGVPELIKRRLMVNGVRGLIIDHEVIESPNQFTEWSEYQDKWSNYKRDPGDPPLDVVHCVDNWWLWCKPGDVIILDECQRFFRPAAIGRKLPKFISALEIHRHYGIDFVIVTQNPNLIHSNVRALVGTHYQLRRLPTPRACLLYEFDQCKSQGSYRSALSVRLWRHKQEDYDSFISSELHTKRKNKIPFVLIIAVLAVPAAGYFVWDAYKMTMAPKQLPGSEVRPGTSAGQTPQNQPVRPGTNTAPAPQNQPVRPGTNTAPAPQNQPLRPGTSAAPLPVSYPVDPKFINSIPKVKWAPPEVISCFKPIKLDWNSCRCFYASPDKSVRVLDDRILCNAVMSGELLLQPGQEVAPSKIDKLPQTVSNETPPPPQIS